MLPLWRGRACFRVASTRSVCRSRVVARFQRLPLPAAGENGCSALPDRGRAAARLVRELRQVGSDLAIIDGAADLEQKEVGASSGPSHLLRLVHPAVHEMIGGPFGDRCPHPQTSAMPRRVIDQPCALAPQITVEPEKGRPELSRSRPLPALCPRIAVRPHHGADAADRAARIRGLAVPETPAQPLDRLDDHRFGRALGLIAGRQAMRGLSKMLQAHGDMKPVQNRRRIDADAPEKTAKTGAAVGERCQCVCRPRAQPRQGSARWPSRPRCALASSRPRIRAACRLGFRHSPPELRGAARPARSSGCRSNPRRPIARRAPTVASGRGERRSSSPALSVRFRRVSGRPPPSTGRSAFSTAAAER